MRARVVLPGPHGHLGRDILHEHAEAAEPFDVVPLARGTLGRTAPRAIERVLGSLDFDALVNCAACTRVDDAEGDATSVIAVNAPAVQAVARASLSGC